LRGSVYYQSAELTKLIFQEGAKKQERTDPSHENYQKVASYKTMESYRNVWNNFFNYLKEYWSIKDCEQIEQKHIVAYMDYKIEYYPSKQYLEKISAAMGKLEIALNRLSASKYEVPKIYDFSIRQELLDKSRDMKLVANNYHNRAYDNPQELISSLSESKHKIAAKIEYEGGARVEGCALIQKEQLLGYRLDPISGSKKGVIFTKEKGGKEGEVLIMPTTYEMLQNEIAKSGKFKLNRQAYYKDIQQACLVLGIKSEGTHGFRWNFAKRRLGEYIKAGYGYEASLQAVSWEMKHNRANITEHYLG